MTALFERLAARAAAIAPLAVPGLQLVPRGAIALAEHVNRYYRVLHGTDPENVAVRLPTGGGSFEVRHSATNAALLRVTDAGLDFPAGGIGTSEIADGAVTSAKILDNEIVNADINAAAAIALAKLAHVGANNVLRSNGTTNVAGQVLGSDITHVGANNVLRSNGTVNVGGQVANADLAGGIVPTKLLHVGAGNVIRSDGAQNVAGQVTSGDIADGTIVNADINAAAAINGSKLADNSVTSAKLAGGIAVGQGTITTTEIADGTIMNVDVNAAAAIAVTKLAAGASGTVLQTSGSAAGWTPNLATAGTVTAGTKFYPNGQANLGLDASVSAVAVGTGGLAQIGTSARMGLFICIDAGSGQSAIFQLHGIGAQTTLLLGSAALFDVVAAANSKVNVICSSGNYYVHNGYAAARTLNGLFLGAGT